MNSEMLFVWIYLPDSVSPVVAGRLQINTTAASVNVGQFVYGKSYLARANAISIDPCTLPLRDIPSEFSSLGGYPGAIIDACPDRWGIRVIDRLCGQQVFPSGYLLTNDPGRAGALAFSRSAEEMPRELASRQFSLADLLGAAEAVEADRLVDPELLQALHPGTGGARPKCNLVEDGAVWIAKFPSQADDPTISIPRLEHATMRLAKACGVNVAETRLRSVGDREVCLVRRFDRVVSGSGDITRTGFVSARSVFYADPAFAAHGTGSYARLARWLGRYGVPVSQRTEIFRRMVFNCAVRNTDDHDLNHGLVQKKNGDFDLAPAYDIVPALKTNKVSHHVLLIGDDASGTVENLLSNAEAFGLEKSEALEIVKEVEDTALTQWRDIFYECGFGDWELNKLERCFDPLPTGDIDLDDVRAPRPR